MYFRPAAVRSFLRVACSLLACAVALAAGRHASAQYQPNMTKSADISAFGTFNVTSPDYGEPNNKGLTAGVDFTRYVRLPIVPAFEVRGWDAHGDVVNEKALLFGPRIGVPIHRIPRLHPYADVMFGVFTIDYVFPGHAYKSDRATDIAYGGGADIDIVRNFAFKIDLLYNTITISDAHTNPAISLTPVNYSFGVNYTIPFRKLTRNSDYH